MNEYLFMKKTGKDDRMGERVLDSPGTVVFSE